MLPRYAERLVVLGLLLLALLLRGASYQVAPPGLSDEELLAIDITEQMRDGLIRVFYVRPDIAGQEGLFSLLNMLHTALVGAGWFGYRVLGLWLGLLALALLYRGARMCFGGSVALMALAIMVSNIWAILMARSVLPTALMLALVMAGFTAVAWAFRLNHAIGPQPPRTLPYTLLGGVCAAALYTEFTGVLLVLVVLAFVVYLWVTRQPVSRYVWSSSLFMVTLVAVMAVPYTISVLRAPSTSGLARFWYDRPQTLEAWLQTLLDTLSSLFYRIPDAQALPALPLLYPLWFVLLLAGMWLALRRWREPTYALVLLLFGVGMLPGLWLQDTRPDRALIVAQPALYILPGLGAFVVARTVQRSEMLGGWRFVATLVGIAFGGAAWQAYDALWQTWPDQDAYHADVVALANYLDAYPPQEPVIFCMRDIYGTAQRYSQPRIAAFAGHREGLPVRYVECRTAFVLANGGEAMQVLQVSPEGLLEATAPVRDWLGLLQPYRALGLPPGAVNRLNAESQLAELAGQLQLQSPLYYPREGREDRMAPLPIRLGRNLSLLGYVPPPERPYAPGDVLMIVSYWRVDGPAPARLGIFTRLHDSPQASPFAETNAMNVLSGGLRERDVLVQTNLITIPGTLPPGEYVITVGAFDNDPLNQIALLNEDGEAVGDYLLQARRIQITPPNENEG